MNTLTPWQAFVDGEIGSIKALLSDFGITLSPDQPHTKGESFLTTKDKLVLIADQDGKKVIVKASRHSNGHDEINREKRILDVLRDIPFARGSLLLPKEILHARSGEYLVWVSEFIDQDQIFVARPLEEQFFLILGALENQEAFHASTFEHLERVKDTFQVWYARDYFEAFDGFQDACHRFVGSTRLDTLLERARGLLHSHKRLIDAYCNYLSHTDFAPSNFRVNNRRLYLIDLSSISFGNKYEGLARLLNYALIHNRELHDLLLSYIKENRGENEYLDLRLMRIYKVGFLLNYYATALTKTSGDLQALTQSRIAFWSDVLEDLIENRPTPEEKISTYKNSRDALRSSEELDRQKQFNKT